MFAVPLRLCSGAVDQVPHAAPGSVVAGKYRVTREIGRGGMGVVVAAQHLQLPQQVAIKFLTASADAEATERFRREAAIVVQLKSEHVCRVMDIGQMPNGDPFIVMELLEGRDLEAVLVERGALPIHDAADYLLQACEGLAEAHALGVVHRDLKPGNIFVTQRPDGSPLIKVLDFGISKAQRPGEDSLTAANDVLGSPRFMSPEQMKSARNAEPRTDIWALGVVLYELLTGRPAFQGETVAELVVAILQDDPAPAVSLRPDLPPDLATVIACAMQKEPANRHENVGAFAMALAPFASPAGQQMAERVARLAGHVAPPQPLPQSSPPSPPSPPSPTPAPPPQAMDVAPPVAPSRGGILIGLVIGAVVALVAVLTVVVVTRSEKPSDGDRGDSGQDDAEKKKKKKDKKRKKKSDSATEMLPERKELEAARADYEAKRHGAAKAKLEKLTKKIQDDGVEPKTPRASVAAEAWLLMGDVQRDTLGWPTPPVLDAKGNPPRDTNRDLYELNKTYGRSLHYWDIAVTQCVDFRMAEVRLRQAKWLWSATLPDGSAATTKPPYRNRLLASIYDTLESASHRIELGAQRAVPKSAQCRKDIEPLREAVDAFRKTLPPEP